MMESSPTLPTLLRLDRAWLELHGQEEAARKMRETACQGTLLEWGDAPSGLFSLLEMATRVPCTLLPGRWMPARPQANGGFGDSAKILWLARSDAALQGLLTGVKLSEDELDGVARAHEPLALLGVPGDVLRSSTSFEDEGIRQRAQKWIGSLGADRVALAILRREGDPLEGLAREWGLPALRLMSVEEEEESSAPSKRSGMAPILCTDFQLDREYRLPDETYVPMLRDLLHRGSLLRERCLYESLPESWRQCANAELELLNEWMLGPLLRRAGALIQTLLPVAGVTVEAPLIQVGGICAWLLGLSERRPAREGRLPDPEVTATALARSLAEWDRRLTARVSGEAWPRLQGRLLPWLEGGLLAACPETPQGGRRFCFSGRALWSRLPLLRDRDGIPRVRLFEEDRRALGWFELELRAAASARSRRTSAEKSPTTAMLRELPAPGFGAPKQLELGLSLERLG